MQTFERLIETLAQHAPHDAGSIEGASTDEIAELERAVGSPLPEIYKEFLLIMGEKIDWLCPSNSRFDIESLTKYHASEEQRPTNEYLAIGLAEEDPFFDTFLEFGQNGETTIVMMPQDLETDFEELKEDWRHPQAGSLPEYIGSTAIRTYKLSKMPLSIRLAADYGKEKSLLSRVDATLNPFDLRSLWFSNDWVKVFDSDDATVIATHFPDGVLALDIAATNNERFDDIQKSLNAQFDLPHQFAI